MPEFEHQGKIYQNPVEFAMSMIGGRWKMPILWRLRSDVMRFGELKKSLPKVTDRALSLQLKDLEEHGFVERKVYPVVPPKVEYSLTEKGRSVIPVIKTMQAFGKKLMKWEGIEEK